ncbi:TetR/AcrR family transcriptional regulator [Georgenia wangjunii]|uniref:TetR/AcrR family transcriptional regulator n=1 Tax=Georgenia wangjunii TaxID=3117730 RepID=UPI002F2633D5
MPKIQGGSLAEHRARTRRALFEALAHLLRERTLDSISMADLAAAAGVGRTAVYNHFPDKEALLLAFIEDETRRYAEDLREALAEATGAVERLTVYVREQARLVGSGHLPHGVDVRRAMSAASRGRLREHVGLVEAILRAILREGIDAGELPDQDLDVVVPLIHGCLGTGTVPSSAAEGERRLAATHRFVLRAVGVPADRIDAMPVTGVADAPARRPAPDADDAPGSGPAPGEGVPAGRAS